MTEIQWLVDIMLNHKLPGPVKDRFIARIGEVEATLAPKPIGLPPISRPPVFSQSPSTQKILDEIAQEQTPISVAPVIPPRRITVPTEVVTSTGNGTFTKGPRKF